MQDLFRNLVTLVSFVTFIGIVFWALSQRRQSDFDEASHLPLNEADDRPRAPGINTDGASR